MSISSPGAVSGAPRVWLRLEGLAVLALAVLLYERGGHSWLLLGALFLAPDLSFLAYLAGPRVGALGYNLTHSYVGPAIAAALAVSTGRPAVVALIWAAHVGFDRALGYGLKYPTDFADTHLGRLRGGRRREPSSGGAPYGVTREEMRASEAGPDLGPRAPVRMELWPEDDDLPF